MHDARAFAVAGVLAACLLAGCASSGPDATSTSTSATITATPTTTSSSTTSSTATPAPDGVWTAFDSVGGLAGPQSAVNVRLVLDGADALWIRFAVTSDGITVEPSLSAWQADITRWMQPDTPTTIEDAHVHEVKRLTLTAFEVGDNRTQLAVWATQADDRESTHQSQCADCFTHSFHHLAAPPHHSSAYGTADEFDAPWAAWTRHMQGLQARVNAEGVSLGS